jgi:hypothetical protein
MEWQWANPSCPEEIGITSPDPPPPTPFGCLKLIFLPSHCGRQKFLLWGECGSFLERTNGGIFRYNSRFVMYDSYSGIWKLLLMPQFLFI